MVLALFLRRRVIIAIAILSTTAQVIMTLASTFKSPLRAFRAARPAIGGRYAGKSDGDVYVFHIGSIQNGPMPPEEAAEFGKD
jgi:hypothetical protein